VLNGLPFKYDLIVTQACIEAGVSGLDVSTVEEQWDLNTAAEEKGVLFVPGVGATPGTTNVMAKHGANLLDLVEEIQINFAAFRCPAPAPGLLHTFLWEFNPTTEERTYYADGTFHPVGPFYGLKTVNFPGPIGEQEVCYIPHEETVTLPKTLGANAVSVRGCFPPHAMQLAKTMLDWGLYSEEPISIKGIEASPYAIIHDLLLQMPECKQTPLWAYGLVVEVFGIKDGNPARVTLWNQHPPMEEWGGSAAYYKNIAIPLSIGVQMIARGDIAAKGVHPPEAVIDPDAFFGELKKRGIEIHQSIETL
jgi:saccharopine dehydrogenase-like NADP-dependent oxidoreductase